MPRKKSTNSQQVTKQIVAAANRTNGLDSKGKALDSFSNVAARMGSGTPSLAQGAEYTLERWSNNYWLMITLFRNHWISRKIVEIPAQDMVKAWPALKCELKPKQISKFDRTIDKTLTKQRIEEALTWSNLFGGAGALMAIDGHEDMLEEPLDLDTVNPGTYKGLITFDRWSGISPDTSDLADDLNYPADYGLPKYYTVKGQDGESMKIHHSRILRFCGPQVPYPEKQAQLLWGISCLEPCYEEIRKRDNVSWAILQLLFRANILGQRNPELAQLLSGLGSSLQASQKYASVLQAQNELLSNQSMVVLGKDGEMFQHAYSFGGIADVLTTYEVAIAGASDIPFSKLFGKQAAGLGAENEGDAKNWEEKIARKQSSEEKPQLDKLYPVICMSEFGRIPEDLDYEFPSIRVLSEKEKAELAKDGTTAILEPFNAGVISQKVALLELKALGDKTGIFTNITDKDIEAADDKPIDPLEIEQAEARAGTETFEDEDGSGPKPKKASAGDDDDSDDEPPSKKKKPKPKSKGKGKGAAYDAMDSIINAVMDEFNESEHPRDDGGKFATAPGEGGSGGESYSSTKPEETTSNSSEPYVPRIHERLKEAVKGKAEIDSVAEALNLGTVIKAPLKSIERALEKTKNDYNGDPERITDLARNTIITKSGKEREALKKIKELYPDAQVKLEEHNVNPLGYSGILIKVPTKSDGMAEIQINTAGVMYAKMNPDQSKKFLSSEQWAALRNNPKLPEPGLGHKLYEEWRIAAPGTPQFIEAANKSKQYYAAFQGA